MRHTHTHTHTHSTCAHGDDFDLASGLALVRRSPCREGRLDLVGISGPTIPLPPIANLNPSFADVLLCSQGWGDYMRRVAFYCVRACVGEGRQIPVKVFFIFLGASKAACKCGGFCTATLQLLPFRACGAALWGGARFFNTQK